MEPCSKHVETAMPTVTSNMWNDVEEEGTSTADSYLTLKEVANLLRFNRNTLYTRIRTGALVIPHYRIGAKMLFKKSEIDAFVISQRVN